MRLLLLKRPVATPSSCRDKSHDLSDVKFLLKTRSLITELLGDSGETYLISHNLGFNMFGSSIPDFLNFYQGIVFPFLCIAQKVN